MIFRQTASVDNDGVLNASALTETVHIDIGQRKQLPLSSNRRDTWVKPLLKTNRLAVSQLLVTQPIDLPHTHNDKHLIYIVVNGHAKIEESANSYHLKKGALIYLPSNGRTSIKTVSPEVEFLVLEILESSASAEPLRNYGTWVERPETKGRMFIVQPDDPPAYEPANHSDTVNRCLFINDDVEVIRGKINTGGGAQKHAHEDCEQLTYVFEPTPQLLFYTPQGVAHGGDTYEAALDLLVIYSPPYRESLNYER